MAPGDRRVGRRLGQGRDRRVQVEPKINGAGKIEPKLIKDAMSPWPTRPDLSGDAVLPSGKADRLYAVSGDDFPSAGYVLFDRHDRDSADRRRRPGLRMVHLVQGVRRQPPRERWGDYGAAAFDGNPSGLRTSTSRRPARSPQYSGCDRELQRTCASLGTGRPMSARSRRNERDRGGVAASPTPARYRWTCDSGTVVPTVAALAAAGAADAGSSNVRGSVVRGPVAPVCRVGIRAARRSRASAGLSRVRCRLAMSRPTTRGTSPSACARHLPGQSTRRLALAGPV